MEGTRLEQDKLNQDIVNQWISGIPLKRGGTPSRFCNCSI